MICPMSESSQFTKRRIYLDHAAAAPVLPAVKAVMLPYLGEDFGNPSAIHQEGQIAKQAIENARGLIARALGSRSSEIYFTGSGTESNNLAILGYLKELKRAGRAYETMEVITTAIEHPSILGLLPIMEELGVSVRKVNVDQFGLISKESLLESLTETTVLVTFAYANSEIGTVQPVLRLSRLIREYAKRTKTTIKIHLDAAQAPLWLTCAVTQLGIDAMTLDAGKCGGPKGVGVLYLHHAMKLAPILVGGGQEDGLRPGTENVAGIVGAGLAISLAQADFAERSLAVKEVTDLATAYLQKTLPEAVINGASAENRLVNNLNFSLPGFDTEYAVVWLDTHGVSASTKSACAGAGSGQSQVVLACTGDVSLASSTIRFSAGTETTKEDFILAIDILKQFCQKMKGLTN